MSPTAKQRYLKKPVDMTHEAFYVLHPTAVKHLDGVVRVLQQWWENELPTIVAHGTDYVETERKGEWRDIPVEEQA